MSQTTTESPKISELADLLRQSPPLSQYTQKSISPNTQCRESLLAPNLIIRHLSEAVPTSSIVGYQIPNSKLVQECTDQAPIFIHQRQVFPEDHTYAEIVYTNEELTLNPRDAFLTAWSIDHNTVLMSDNFVVPALSSQRFALNGKGGFFTVFCIINLGSGCFALFEVPDTYLKTGPNSSIDYEYLKVKYQNISQ